MRAPLYQEHIDEVATIAPVLLPRVPSPKTTRSANGFLGALSIGALAIASLSVLSGTVIGIIASTFITYYTLYLWALVSTGHTPPRPPYSFMTSISKTVVSISKARQKQLTDRQNTTNPPRPKTGRTIKGRS